MKTQRQDGPSLQRGFTLIEIMIVVAVVAIIAAIAIPQYRDYVIRAKRADAKRALLEAAQFLERNYTANGCYNYGAPGACQSQSGAQVTLPAVLSRAPAEGRASYQIPPPTFTNSGQAFSLVAIPCGAGGSCPAGSDPFVDPVCDRFTLQNTGERGLIIGGTAYGGADPQMATCWQR